VLQLVWLSVDIIIYTPFVIIFNLMDDAKTDREEELISDAQEVRNL
jgi:PTS system cellobiose-specific IIC component